MANTIRTYSKSNPEKELLLPQPKPTVEAEVEALHVPEIQSPEYQKPEEEEITKAFFVIVSGGEVREKDYFKIIAQQDKFKRIKLEFIADPLKLSPVGMLELAQYKKARYDSSKSTDEEPDKIYLISDVDHFMSELHKIKPICNSEGFRLIISNSCFEVWLYYAYCDTAPAFSLPTDPLKTSSKFKGWLPSAIRGGVKTTRAILNIYQNIVNAKKNYKEDENGIPVLFSTNMFELALDLIPLIEPELTNLIEKNKRTEAELRDRKKK